MRGLQPYAVHGQRARLRRMTIAERFALVQERIAAACDRSGRNPESVTLLAVSKTKSAADVDEAVRAGVREIGENRVQEAREKFTEMTTRPRKHLIGTLQSNKAKLAVELFDEIQTVESEGLAAAIQKRASAADRVIDAWVQVNIGHELQKSGVDPERTRELVAFVRNCSHLRFRGLMAIPPHVQATEGRTYFRELRTLRDQLVERGIADPDAGLSIGMTEDFEIAIEEGATLVRVGRAIFGERG